MELQQLQCQLMNDILRIYSWLRVSPCNYKLWYQLCKVTVQNCTFYSDVQFISKCTPFCSVRRIALLIRHNILGNAIQLFVTMLYFWLRIDFQNLILDGMLRHYLGGSFVRSKRWHNFYRLYAPVLEELTVWILEGSLIAFGPVWGWGWGETRSRLVDNIPRRIGGIMCTCEVHMKTQRNHSLDQIGKP